MYRRNSMPLNEKLMRRDCLAIVGLCSILLMQGVWCLLDFSTQDTITAVLKSIMTTTRVWMQITIVVSWWAFSSKSSSSCALLIASAWYVSSMLGRMSYCSTYILSWIIKNTCLCCQGPIYSGLHVMIVAFSVQHWKTGSGLGTRV